MVERVQLTLNDTLGTAEVDGRELDEKYPRGPFLSSPAYAIRSPIGVWKRHGTAHKIYCRLGRNRAKTPKRNGS
jgi:hypothetical protein